MDKVKTVYVLSHEYEGEDGNKGVYTSLDRALEAFAATVGSIFLNIICEAEENEWGQVKIADAFGNEFWTFHDKQCNKIKSTLISDSDWIEMGRKITLFSDWCTITLEEAKEVS